jgi:two-component system nitrate/nitrite response regulator NarL
MTQPLKILLVDDHILFRKGMASLLSSRDGMRVVGEAGDGCEAIEKTRETSPDIILMDVHMPRCDGLEAVRVIKSEVPTVKIIMVTVDEQDKVLFEAVKNGAQGYLLKKMHPQQLFDMVMAVARGEVALSQTMMAKILNEFQHPSTGPGRDSPPREELSSRETQVLELVARGATNREIGNTLGITENTVKKHLQSILTKLHLRNRIQAAVYAVQEGLLSDNP